MKSRVTLLALFLAALMLMAWQFGTAVAQDQPTAPPAKGKKPELNNAQNVGERPEGGPDLAGLYAELRELAKNYKEARSEDAKQRIVARAEELMGQILDAKVQKDQKRIEAEERHLNAKKEALKEKQLHKQDLVHQGVQRFFETGELPEWITRESQGAK